MFKKLKKVAEQHLIKINQLLNQDPKVKQLEKTIMMNQRKKMRNFSWRLDLQKLILNCIEVATSHFQTED